VTRTEEEALILENQLIKLHRPRYNIALKDDKNYPYIKLSHEPFPKIIITRNRLNDGARYFGPYPSLGPTKLAYRLLHEIFPLRDCKQAVTLTKRQPKCIKLDMKTCLGPCVHKNIQDEYNTVLEELVLFLKGKNNSLLHQYKEKMIAHSDRQEFEKAVFYRDKIKKLMQLMTKQSVVLSTEETVHIVACAESDTHDYLVVQQFVEGKLLYQQGFFQEKTDRSPSDFWVDSLLSCYADAKTLPETLITQEKLLTCLQNMETQVPGWKVKLICPQKGDKLALLENAERNARLSVIRISKARYNTTQPKENILAYTKTAFQLTQLPKLIWGFDISHHQGTDIVASCVCFKNGVPEKSAYRHFKIRSVKDKSNDPESMYEVVLRRLDLALKESEPIAQLLLIDGGKGQLNYAESAVKSMVLPTAVELVSLAKREEEVYLINQKWPLKLPKEDPALKLLMRVRDEAHRFALRLQRKQRWKVLKKSSSR